MLPRALGNTFIDQTTNQLIKNVIDTLTDSVVSSLMWIDLVLIKAQEGEIADRIL